MSKPFGIDISQHQGKMDWDVVAASPMNVQFVGIRVGISWGYTDKWFSFNWEEALRVKIPRTAYHVFYPLSDVTRQVKSIKKNLGNDYGEMPITADIELDHGASKTQFSTNLKRYVEEIEAEFGRKPIIYSRASFFDAHIDPNFSLSMGNSYKWWMANYPRETGVEATFPPAIPKHIDRGNVIIHQTSDTMPKIGAVGGNSMDYNRWLLSEEELRLFTGQQEVPQKHKNLALVDQIDVIREEVEELARMVRRP